jgi:hypothetical protein
MTVNNHEDSDQDNHDMSKACPPFNFLPDFDPTFPQTLGIAKVSWHEAKAFVGLGNKFNNLLLTMGSIHLGQQRSDRLLSKIIQHLEQNHIFIKAKTSFQPLRPILSATLT